MQSNTSQNQMRDTLNNAENKTDQLKQTAIETVDAAKDEAKKMAGTVKDQAQQTFQSLKHEVKDQALTAAEEVKQQAGSKLNEQRTYAADRLSGVATALRETGQRLSSENDESIGHYAENMADQVERFSSYVRDRDINELLGEVQSFARRQPELFVAGTLAAGFLLGRFLKSSSRRREVERYGAPNAQSYAQTSSYRPGSYQPAQSSFGDSPYGTPQSASGWREEGAQWTNR